MAIFLQVEARVCESFEAAEKTITHKHDKNRTAAASLAIFISGQVRPAGPTRQLDAGWH
jgi:hypothetical protein